MASPIEVCNTALSRIGIDQLIEDFNDGNTRSRACLFHYSPRLLEVLQDFPWGFAQRVVQLAIVADVTVPGYQYVYRYPTGCLRAQILTDEAGARLPVANIYTDVWNYDLGLAQVPRWPFVVMADPDTPGARIIATDLEGAYLWHTAEISDINGAPPLFRSALAWRIAAELALLLRADTRLHANAMQQYMWAASQAQVHSQLEGVSDNPAVPQAVQVRY